MYDIDLENIEPDDIKDIDKCEDIDETFESSFTYHAVPLDKQLTLDESDVPFTLKELMDLKELREGKK